MNKIFNNCTIEELSLLKASRNRKTRTVSEILSNPKNQSIVNAQDGKGLTPLMYAVRSNSMKIADILLDHGADIFIKNKRGETALDIATDKKNLRALLLSVISKRAIVAALSLSKSTSSSPAMCFRKKIFKI